MRKPRLDGLELQQLTPRSKGSIRRDFELDAFEQNLAALDELR
jgi:hypothetical protein